MRTAEALCVAMAIAASGCNNPDSKPSETEALVMGESPVADNIKTAVRAKCEEIRRVVSKSLDDYTRFTGNSADSWGWAGIHAEEDCLVEHGLLDGKEIEAKRKIEMNTPRGSGLTSVL